MGRNAGCGKKILLKDTVKAIAGNIGAISEEWRKLFPAGFSVGTGSHMTAFVKALCKITLRGKA